MSSAELSKRHQLKIAYAELQQKTRNEECTARLRPFTKRIKERKQELIEGMQARNLDTLCVGTEEGGGTRVVRLKGGTQESQKDMTTECVHGFLQNMQDMSERELWGQLYAIDERERGSAERKKKKK